MKKITIDTNIITDNTVIEICDKKGYEYTCISVTNREVEGTSFEEELKHIPSTPEYAVIGESRFGCARYHGQESSGVLREILDIISNGSFPKKGDSLSKGYRNMLRDAIILQTHITDKRDIFITNDQRGFIKNDLREKLESKFDIEILTAEEFINNNS